MENPRSLQQLHALGLAATTPMGPVGHLEKVWQTDTIQRYTLDDTQWQVKSEVGQRISGPNIELVVVFWNIRIKSLELLELLGDLQMYLTTGAVPWMGVDVVPCGSSRPCHLENLAAKLVKINGMFTALRYASKLVNCDLDMWTINETIRIFWYITDAKSHANLGLKPPDGGGQIIQPGQITLWPRSTAVVHGIPNGMVSCESTSF